VFWPLSRFRTWLGWLAFRRAVSSAAVLNLSRFLQSTVRPLFLQRYLRPECAWRHGYAGGLVSPEISQRPVKSIYLISLPRTFACACCPKVKVGRAPTCQTQLGWRCEWCFPVIRLLFWKTRSRAHMSRAAKGGKVASACHPDGVRIARVNKFTGDHLQRAHRDAQKDDSETGSSQPGQRLGESGASARSARFPARLPKDAGPALAAHAATAPSIAAGPRCTCTRYASLARKMGCKSKQAPKPPGDHPPVQRLLARRLLNPDG
jgi:hypothetical protein